MTSSKWCATLHGEHWWPLLHIACRVVPGAAWITWSNRWAMRTSPSTSAPYTTSRWAGSSIASRPNPASSVLGAGHPVWRHYHSALGNTLHHLLIILEVRCHLLSWVEFLWTLLWPRIWLRRPYSWNFPQKAVKSNCPNLYYNRVWWWCKIQDEMSILSYVLNCWTTFTTSNK